MGMYVNPTNGMTKEEYLIAFGTPISRAAVRQWKDFSHTIPVALIYNPQFTAAFVMFEPRELERGTSDNDCRPMIYWAMPIEKLDCPESGIGESYRKLLRSPFNS